MSPESSAIVDHFWSDEQSVKQELSACICKEAHAPLFCVHKAMMPFHACSAGLLEPADQLSKQRVNASRPSSSHSWRSSSLAKGDLLKCAQIHAASECCGNMRKCMYTLHVF